MLQLIITRGINYERPLIHVAKLYFKSIFQKCASTKHETMVIFINEFIIAIGERTLSLLIVTRYFLLFLVQ